MKNSMILALILLFSFQTSAEPVIDTKWQHTSERDAVGRIYYYERSNSDGSMDERITVFRASATEIEVYKSRNLCRNAALVTADLNLSALSTPRITGGRLQPNAERIEFAFMRLDEATRELRAEVRLPNVELTFTETLERPDWTLFDFDLAGLTVMTPHLATPRDGFGFGMALLWSDPNAAKPLSWMGDVNARFVGTEKRLNTNSLRFDLSGTAFAVENSVGTEGSLWLDAEHGHIVDAIMPVPNHPGYTDFRLRLIRYSDGGKQEWTELLTRHFAGCAS